MIAERRRSPRVRVPEGAGGVIRSTIQVKVQDISRTGVRFQLSGPVRPGATYAFHADLGEVDLAVSIRITRCKAGAAPRGSGAGGGLVYQAGAEFIWENPADEERLGAWLARRGSDTGAIQAKLQG